MKGPAFFRKASVSQNRLQAISTGWRGQDRSGQKISSRRRIFHPRFRAVVLCHSTRQNATATLRHGLGLRDGLQPALPQNDERKGFAANDAR